MIPNHCDFQSTGGKTPKGTPLYACSRCERGPVPSRTGQFGEIVCNVQPEGYVPPPKPEQPERPTAETLPCVHRGELTGDEVECGCGEQGEQLPVYFCALKTQCTIVSPGRIARIGGRKVAVCFQACDEKREA